jgi:hypothetical protein
MSWIISSFVVVFCIQASAADGSSATAVAPASTVLADSSNWFVYLGTGFAPYPQHDGALQGQISEVASTGLWSITAGELAFPGLYYRISDRQMVGFLPSALLEQYGRDRTDPRNYAIRSYSGLASYFEFLSDQHHDNLRFGEGFFYSAELGVEYLEVIGDTSILGTNSYDFGATVQLTGGYGFQFFDVGTCLIHVGPYLTKTGSHTLWGGLFQMGFLL